MTGINNLYGKAGPLEQIRHYGSCAVAATFLVGVVAVSSITLKGCMENRLPSELETRSIFFHLDKVDLAALISSNDCVSLDGRKISKSDDLFVESMGFSESEKEKCQYLLHNRIHDGIPFQGMELYLPRIQAQSYIGAHRKR